MRKQIGCKTYTKLVTSTKIYSNLYFLLYPNIHEEIAASSLPQNSLKLLRIGLKCFSNQNILRLILFHRNRKIV